MVVDGWVGVDGWMDVDVTVQMKKFRKPPPFETRTGEGGGEEGHAVPRPEGCENGEIGVFFF